MSANTAAGVLDEVRRIVKRDLAPITARIDVDGFYPEEVLRAIGAAGGMRLHLPSQRRAPSLRGAPSQQRGDSSEAGTCDMAASIEVMAAVGERCLSTAFLLWCQYACSWYIENSDSAALREAVLPGLASGAILGGTALSNPMKFLSGIEPLQLVARAVPGGFRVRGQLPWVSNLGAGHYFGAVFRVEHEPGREVMAMVSCDAEGLRMTQDAHFTALEGTRTFSLRFDEVFVPAHQVLGDPAGPYLARIRAGFVLMQTGMALGLVQGCIDIMHKSDRALAHVNRFLPQRPEMFEQELAALRADIHAAAQVSTEETPAPVAEAAYFRQVAALRLRASELSLDAARAAMLHAGARGYLVRSPAQRRVREAFFIAIVTPALKHLRKELAA